MAKVLFWTRTGHSFAHWSVYARIWQKTWHVLARKRDLFVPCIPQSLQSAVISSAHLNIGHGGWETTWQTVRKHGYFPGIAAKCQEYVQACGSCQAASPATGEVPPSEVNDAPISPWDIMHVDLLELGPEQGSTYHCVFVCMDAFSRWMEVVLLAHHDGRCATEAFCC